MRHVFRSGWARAAGALVFLSIPVLAAQAHLIIFKDGFVLEGQVKRETKTYFDEYSKEPILIPKGFFMIDDGARRIVFSPAQARIVERKSAPAEESVRGRSASWLKPLPLPPLLEVVQTGEWTDKMDREFRFRSPNGVIKLTQQVRMLTPSHVLVDAPGRYIWGCAYLTRELGPEAVLALLAVAPDLQPSKAKDAAGRAAQRFRIADFLAQAGWYDLAEKELERIAGTMADQKPRVEAAMGALAKLRTRDLFEDIKRLHLAGQFTEARRRIAGFPEKDASEQTVAELREIKAEYEQTDERLRDSSRLLEELRQQAVSADAEALAAAAGIVGRELGPESVGRLDAFLGQAKQWERQRRAGRKPDLGPPELLSLAVSGWLLGSAAAEAKPETALRVWRARQMLLEYLRTTDRTARDKLLQGFLKDAHYEATVDEIQWMIPHLPPVEPLEKITPQTQGRKLPSGEYFLRLPPEYRPTRPWPVLIVLHQAGQKPQDMLGRWAEMASENGYVLAAPAWGGADGTYTYSDGEHKAVLETLRDLRQRVNIDSDRVFLFGFGEGGALAFDVGLSHPDLFAGVIPMGAGPEKFSRICWRNGQNLPFYVVNGNRSGPATSAVVDQFKNWIQNGYPMLWVDYKGRGVEWFSAELPNIFDWIHAKRRIFPLHQLGTDGNGTSFGNEFCTMRPSDNRFYWLAPDQIHKSHFNDPSNWKNGVQPATATARIDTDENQVFVRTTGIGKLTLWLGRTPQGAAMIDFDRPLTVRVNLAPIWNRRKVAPSLQVMLEDLFERGDRQQMFLGKVELNLK
jgi:pimeloyl-ACP methyl ester carboxylesterase